MIQKKTANVIKLISDSVQLAVAGCQVVRSHYEKSAHFQQYTKTHAEDFVTEADFKVQRIITKGLGINFKQLQIIGEQAVDYTGKIEFDFGKLQNIVFPTSDLLHQKQINIQDLCAWIDPIDSTLGLVNGNIQDVSILIGFSQNKKSQIGIVGIPYRISNQKKQAIYDPTIYMASIPHKIAYKYKYFTNQWINLETKEHKIEEDCMMTVSNSPQGKLEDIFIEQMERKNHRVGGVGHRISMVIEGSSCLAVFAPKWTSKWDTCSGQAIIKALGGSFTDQNGEQLIYDPASTNYLNEKGIISTLNESLFKKSVKVYHQYSS